MQKAEMVGDNFRLGCRAQRHWGAAMAAAFFCGELGAGLFLVSMLCGVVPGMILGLLIKGIGKPFFHLTHMGVPGKSWRAILRPDRSWTSRGLIATIVFMGAGILHTINVMTAGAVPLGGLLPWLAGASALIVMTYQGFAMSQSSAVALWNTAMMPISSLLYGLTGGVVLTLPLAGGGLATQLSYLAMGLLLADLMMLLGLLYGAYHGAPGGKLSAELLIRTLYAKWFHGVVLAAGILLPFAALWLGGGAPTSQAVGAVGVLAGFFTFRVLIFKAGLFEPVMHFDI
ncbi:MAG: hypothetical protein QGG19_02995 [Alphaproteobacteria bacterium]|jgi:DMSO reductase anchor subunit|nr:hypothetical protein [Rhodospirillaceae bacterium]MDP6020264.1 hypothetical protein [Alphaproteobacteria bacterium]MDP6256062.1 hypothetical protein [Alphaproteobacteria bacterium]MDP7054290.1 hypothetical protein [Alphaproteobacteria bacterium]MDP7230587.1 hypothetical protein [Alphaproteobacteria bacterium]